MRVLDPAAELAQLFDLVEVGGNHWQGPTQHTGLPQLFGGQLVGQSVAAAGRSVDPEKRVRSIHTHFLAAGSRDTPVDYQVRPVRDGRLLSVREVTARQQGRLLGTSTVTCSIDLDGIAHTRPMPRVAPPAKGIPLAELAESSTGLGEFWDTFTTIELRLAVAEAPPTVSAPSVTSIWMRSATPLPDDPLIHTAALAYASDLALMETALEQHGYRRGQARTLERDWSTVSLNHAVWFQAPAKFDDWLLFELTSPTAFGGRSVITSSMFDGHGLIAGQASQEALVRRL